MRPILLLVIASVGAGVSAQAVYDPLDFAALQVGNRWEYLSSAGHTEATAAPLFYTLAEIPTTMVIDGETYFVLTQQRISLDGTPDQPLSHCAYHPTLGAATATQAQLPNYACPLLPSPPPAPSLQNGPTFVDTQVSFVVGPTTYVADLMLRIGNQSQGSGGAYQAYTTRWVHGLGYLSYALWGRTHWAGCQTNPADCDFWQSTRLAFARISGQTYGASVVAGDAPPALEGWSVQVVPTPAVGPWQVRLHGADGVSAIAVYDLLGREVYAGTSATRVPDLASGLYVLRATTADGRTATTRFVRP